MVGPAKYKLMVSTNWLQFYIRAVIESEAWSTVVQLKRKP